MNNEQIDAQPVEHEPHERETTDAEYESGPDFEGIAERLDLLERLGSDGWWGNAGSWDGEDETILRVVGPVIARAAYAEAHRPGEHGYSPTADLLEATASQLDYFARLVAGEADGLSEWADRTMKDLFALAEAVERHRGGGVN